MKGTIMFLISTAIFMAAVPAAVCLKIQQPQTINRISLPASYQKQKLTVCDPSSGEEETYSAKQLVRSLVGAAVSNDFEPEAVKALSCAYLTQLYYEDERSSLSFDTKDDKLFLDEASLKEKFSDEYKSFCDCCDEAHVVKSSNGKAVNLNLTDLSRTHSVNTALLPRADPYASLLPDYMETVSFTEDELFSALGEIKTEINPENSIGKITYLPSGEVETIEICGKRFSGSEIKKRLSLPHTYFSVEYSLGKFIFKMQRSSLTAAISPKSAEKMAEQGNSCNEILICFYGE